MKEKYVFKTYQNQSPRDENYNVIDDTVLDVINWMQDIEKRKNSEFENIAIKKTKMKYIEKYIILKNEQDIKEL